MKIVLLVIVYFVLAHEIKWFPFNKKKDCEKNLPPHIRLEDFSLNELREAYYKKMASSNTLTPGLMKLENEFCELVKRTDQLVHIEYPQSTWSFHDKNVGASIVLNTRIGIDIFTYDGRMEQRFLNVRNHKAYRFENLYNDASPYGSPNPSEVFFSEEPQTNEEKNNGQNSEETLTLDEYVNKWCEMNFDYVEHLSQVALDNDRNTILIGKDLYEEKATQKICAFLVENWGFESCSPTEDGILAAIYN